MLDFIPSTRCPYRLMLDDFVVHSFTICKVSLSRQMSKKIELLTKHHCLKSCHASAIVYNLGVKLKKKKKKNWK
jgi:hypothetical protein